jgi:hypothetical protein
VFSSGVVEGRWITSIPGIFGTGILKGKIPVMGLAGMTEIVMVVLYSGV